ncbi:MAG: RnfABCDGE type electron transport complex subunit D [bacterium]|nr:RnfABCDGE type electron transport complex subunit D [bacterium]
MAEKKESRLFVLSSAPHVKSTDTVSKVMYIVILALLPSAIYSVYIFGINALLIMLAGVLGAVGAEAACQYALKKPITIKDGSAVITGLLVAMNAPPQAPVWMVVLGSIFAIIIVKQLFGGLGFNIFNPALAARAFMMSSWPVHMTTSWHKFSGDNVLAKGLANTSGIPEKVFDAITQATPLAVLKESSRLVEEYDIGIEQLHDLLFSPEMLKSLFIGNVGGVIGETSALLLLIGGLVLMFKKIISWHIPVSFIGSVAILAYLYYTFIGFSYPEAVCLVHILSGGVFMGAFFMATDMVTSPVTKRGMLLFGAGCGTLTFGIRIIGGYPEGVSYAILLMNAVVPLIDRFIRPKVFGVAGE